MKKNSTSELTPYAPGTLQELWHVSYPLMLNGLAICLMSMVDRVLLGHYSIDAMNGAMAAIMFSSIFILGMANITGMAQVFVGRYNGAGEYHRMGQPIWQMIWLSLFSIPIFTLLSKYSGAYLLADAFHKEGLPYYDCIIYMGPIEAIVIAFTSFFIARGKTKLILYVNLAVVLLNVGLDYLFIFGYGPIPEWGSFGAALATLISQSFVLIIFLCVFLNKENRTACGTTNYHIDLKLIYRSIRIGAPIAAAYMMCLLGNSYLFNIMAMAGTIHITVFSIGQIASLILSYVGNALQKGLVTVSSNLIGAKNHLHIPRSLRGALIISLIITTLIAIPFIMFPEWTLINLFDLELAASLLPILKNALIYVCLFSLINLVVWSYAGILMSAEDTFFIMCTAITSNWLLSVLPMYYFIGLKQLSALYIWPIMLIYGIANIFIYGFRYRRKLNNLKFTD